MRRICFRGKCEETGEWVYGNYVYNNGDYIFVDNQFYEVDSKTVGQITGQTDSKGVDIFENDVIKVKGDEPYSNGYFTTEYDWEMEMVVKFVYGAFELQALEDRHMTMYFCETEDMELERIKI